MTKLNLKIVLLIQAFLEARLWELSQKREHISHYIFTDSDIAVVDDLGHIFHDFPNFHLAFTFRNNKAQPLNSGFIAVRGTADGILRCALVSFNSNLVTMELEMYLKFFNLFSVFLRSSLSRILLSSACMVLQGKEIFTRSA